MRYPILRISTILIVLAILSYSCDSSNSCEEGFVQQYGPDGSTFCIPEFEEGMLSDFKLGDSYFHEEYGVIQNNDGIWLDQFNVVITP